MKRIIIVLLLSIVLSPAICAAVIDDNMRDAIEKNDTGKVGELIAKGADVNARTNNGETALSLAMSSKYSDMECLIIEAPVLSAEAARAGTSIAEEGGAVNMDESDHLKSPLKVECSDPTKIVKLLVEAGADVNIKDSAGRTPLMLAASGGYTEIAKLLVAKGADVNAKSGKGETALSLAKSRHNDEIARLLGKAGAK